MIETLKFYISQLSPKRSEIYSKSWWTVGFIIYKQTKGSEEGFNLWHTFSQKDVKRYNKNFCDKKWESFKKAYYSISIGTLADFVKADGGSIYNPNHDYYIESEEVRNFVYKIIIPKLSIQRMRNGKALDNLCSAMYHMSSGKDRDAMLEVCKRIKDKQLKESFVYIWDFKKFTFCETINDIIDWHNNDETEKPNPRATDIKSYFNNNPLWLEQTTNYLKLFDNRGFTPRYFKITAEERDKLRIVVYNRKRLNRAINAKCFDTAEIIMKNIIKIKET